MAITNGYCTRAEALQRIARNIIYTATTISFTTTTNVIGDTAYGLKRFQTGDIISVSGSTSNDGTYTVTTGNVASQIVTTESLTTEAAGDTVTISLVKSTATKIDPVDGLLVDDLVTAASRWIDNHTGTWFYAATDTRYYKVGDDTCGRVLWLDRPLLSVTTLTNGDGQEITTGNYRYTPVNDAPYYQIVLYANSGYVWQYEDDRDEDLISVAGTWGFSSSTPAPIKEACLLLVNALYKRKDAPFGVAGKTALGDITLAIPNDPHVAALLRPYRVHL